ncbi:hypothetical protein CROQUDRAFT_91527 [Cronartium quercuum f. sp. fusiforme G11]|uniref:Uncharacterized protein n=1 Tax=Cronartium quercuum f. sp. fusiforme G11 TaxID=708437 RepID=A0A9P6TD87_9BASI|nr:hypothetical protein CROQUDRAFT_91527 [Cronartium quercuum f. sp. fusiforme G11]
MAGAVATHTQEVASSAAIWVSTSEGVGIGNTASKNYSDKAVRVIFAGGEEAVKVLKQVAIVGCQ